MGEKGQGANYNCMFLEPNGKVLQEISDLIEQVYLCPYFGFLDLLPFMCWCAPLLMMTGKCLSLWPASYIVVTFKKLLAKIWCPSWALVECLHCRESWNASRIEPMICSHKSGEIAYISVVSGSSLSVLHTTGLLLPTYVLKRCSSDVGNCISYCVHAAGKHMSIRKVGKPVVKSFLK